NEHLVRASLVLEAVGLVGKPYFLWEPNGFPSGPSNFAPAKSRRSELEESETFYRTLAMESEDHGPGRYEAEILERLWAPSADKAPDTQALPSGLVPHPGIAPWSSCVHRYPRWSGPP